MLSAGGVGKVKIDGKKDGTNEYIIVSTIRERKVRDADALPCDRPLVRGSICKITNLLHYILICDDSVSAIRCNASTSFLDFSIYTAGGVGLPEPPAKLAEYAMESALDKVRENSSACSVNSTKSSASSRNTLMALSIWNKGLATPCVPNCVRMASPPPLLAMESQFSTKASMVLTADCHCFNAASEDRAAAAAQDVCVVSTNNDDAVTTTGVVTAAA